jgi:phosphatidylglycerophosphatase C
VTPLDPTPVVAAFDFDGTLTRADSVIPFMRRFARRPPVVVRALGELPRVLVALARGDRDRLRAAATRAVLTGVPRAEVDGAGREFAAEIVAGRLRADTTERLRWHVAEGHRVVIVSASYDCYLHDVAAALGAEAVLSTRLDVRDGRCTGALIGGNCRGAEKVARLDAWLAGQGLDRDEVELWAYGDSAGDRELLEYADHAVWVRGPLDSATPARGRDGRADRPVP